MVKVLIIEDESAYQKILKTTLEKEGFEINLASNFVEASAQITNNRPDIILLDIMLPGGKNGFDFLEQVKGNQQTKDIPVIIVTNLSSEEKVSRQIGASFYFVKSDTSIEEIIKKVKEVLN